VPGNYRLIHSGDVKLYENMDVMDRAYLVSNWQWAPDSEASLAALNEPGFDVRNTAVLTPGPGSGAPLQVPGPQPKAQQPDQQGQARIVSYSSDQVIVRTRSSASSVLILTDAYYPGWQATLDGRPAPIYQANGLFRAVFVPEGEHEVTFRFNSTAYRLGLTIFIFSIVTIASILVGLMGFSRRKS
jgi:hypothetical protein